MQSLIRWAALSHGTGYLCRQINYNKKTVSYFRMGQEGEWIFFTFSITVSTAPVTEG